MASSHNKPDQVKLTAEEAEGLKRRLATDQLTDADKTVLSGLVSFSLWLQQQLEMAKLSIRRLKKLFGVSTEKSKKSKLTSSTDDSSATDGDEHDDGDNSDAVIAVEREKVSSDGDADSHSSTDAEVTSSSKPRCPPRFDPDHNHGRYGYADYPGCEEIVIAHPTLQAGDACPACQQHHTAGRLYRVEPGVLVCLEGQPLIGGKRYQLEKLRCTVCGHLYSTEPPLEIQQAGKYAPSVAATLAWGRYGMGLPFHRIEAWQAMQQIPMPDATAWDEVLKLAQAVKPMYTLVTRFTTTTPQTKF